MMSLKYHLALLAFASLSVAQEFDYQSAPRPAPQRIQAGYSGPAAPRPTPVPILKQINRHNEDGSYTYGYESADGAFKIETKLPTGEVRGKYGYVDDTGKVRVVEYGATKYGFEPAGEGITVAPPTLVDETTNRDGTLNPEYTGAYYDDQQQQAPPRAAAPRPRPRPQQSYESYSQQFSPAPQQFAPAPQRSAAPVPPRAQIPGAAPVGPSTTHNFEFGPPTAARSFTPSAPARAPASYARPAPIEEEYREQPAPTPIRSSPRITYAQPAQSSKIPDFDSFPQSAPAPQRSAPQYAPRPQSSGSPIGRSGGILDQLSKDYALPAGGAAPLHDISFGYY